MAYEPIDPGSEGVLGIYIVLVIFSFIMSGLMLKKWRERETKPTQLMFVMFSILTVAIIVIMAGMIELVIAREKRELYMFSLAAGYTLMMVSHLVMINFAKIIFNIEETWTKIYSIIAVITAVLVALPLNGYGKPNEEVSVSWFRPVTSVLMVVFSIIVYSQVAKVAFDNSKKAEAALPKAGFKWIGFSQLCMIGFFVFLMLDVVWFTISGGGGYTAFVYFAWIFAGLFFLFCYMGLIMPDWLKKRYVS